MGLGKCTQQTDMELQKWTKPGTSLSEECRIMTMDWLRLRYVLICDYVLCNYDNGSRTK